MSLGPHNGHKHSCHGTDLRYVNTRTACQNRIVHHPIHLNPPIPTSLLTVGGLAGAVKPDEIAESFARAGAVVEGVELMRDADGAWANRSAA